MKSPKSKKLDVMIKIAEQVLDDLGLKHSLDDWLGKSLIGVKQAYYIYLRDVYNCYVLGDGWYMK